MLLGLLKKLSGTEIKLLFVILLLCDEKYEWKGMESLGEDFGFSYPTVLKSVQKLERRKAIKKIDIEGAASILQIRQEFRHIADHMRKIPNQLTLFSDEEVLPDHKPKVWWKKQDQDAVIRHYALEQGVPIEKLKEWNSGNYGRNVTAAQRLMNYCGSLTACMLTITNCRIERSRSRLSWSLAGDVLRNIQQFAPKQSAQVGGEKKWQ